MKRFFYLVLIISAGFLFASCDSKEKKHIDIDEIIKSDPRNDSTMVRSHEDSTKVLDLTKKYLDLLKDKKYTEAIAQLSKFDRDTKTIVDLTDEEKAARIKKLEYFPVLSYTIDEIRMYAEDDTEVFYTVTMFEKQEGEKMPNTIKCSVQPRRVNGEWKLTISKIQSEN